MLGLRYWAVCACVGAGLYLGLSSSGWANDDDNATDEIEVSINKVPAPVKKTILKQAGKNKIDEIERIRTKLYEAEWLVGDIEVEISVSATGRVERIEVEAAHDEEDEKDENGDDEDEGDEKKVKLNRVPQPVKKTILRLADGKKIAEIEEVTTTVYEADWTVKGKEVEILVSSEGRLLGKEVEEPNDDDDDDNDDDDDD